MSDVFKKIKVAFLNIDIEQLKTTVLATFIIGLIAHGFCFFNANFSHDGLTCLNYSSELFFDEYLQMGRFLRPAYQALNCNWEIPWLNGLLTLLFLSISFFIINNVLGIKKKKYVIISCAILTTCSSVSLLNATYLHDIDSYSLALLFVSLGLWISRVDNSSWWGRLLAVPFYVISLGLYQAYIQVAIFVYIILFVMNLLDGKDVNESFIELVKDALVIMLSALIYYACYRLALLIFNVKEGTAYNSVSVATNSVFETWKDRLHETFMSEINWFIYPNANKQSFVLLLNVLLVVIAAYLIIRISIKNKISRNSIIVMCLVLVFMPFAVNVITFVSNQSHALTLFPLFFIYIFDLVLVQKAEELLTMNIRKVVLASVVIFSLMIVDNCFFSNRLYLQKDLISKNTLSTMTRIIDRIEQLDEYELGKTKVALVGQLNMSPLSLTRDGSINDERATGMSGNFSPTYYGTYRSYFQNYLGYPMNLLSEQESSKYKENEEVKKMGAFPAKDSCKIIDGVLVIKLSLE